VKIVKTNDLRVRLSEECERKGVGLRGDGRGATSRKRIPRYCNKVNGTGIERIDTSCG